MNQSYNSVLLDTAVSELSKLPGIGHKTALRLALHLLRKEAETSYALGNAIIEMRKGIAYCPVCHNISEGGICQICSNPRRDRQTICVVENVKDVLTREEIILALSPTMEGDTTNFYIYRKLADLPVKVTMLARGLSIGNELEYTDELTLGRSILNRTLFSTNSDD